MMIEEQYIFKRKAKINYMETYWNKVGFKYQRRTFYVWGK